MSPLSVRTFERHAQQRPLSKSSSFDQNFMKLGHIVWYPIVFFKPDNGPYRPMPQGVKRVTIGNEVQSNSFDQNFIKLGHIV